MTSTDNQKTNEIWDLLEALCEDRLTPVEHQRLDDLVVSNAKARRTYVEYMALHGSLHWDAALTTGIDLAEDSFSPSDDSLSFGEFDQPVALPTDSASVAQQENPSRRRWVMRGNMALAACLFIGLGALAQHFIFTDRTPDTNSQNSLSANSSSSAKTESDHPNRIRTGKTDQTKDHSAPDRTPIAKVPVPAPKIVKGSRKDSPPVVAIRPRPKPFIVPAGGSNVDVVVAAIDERLEHQWNEHGVQPSPRAEDGEWLRRVTLDLIGRIPTVNETEQFLSSPDLDKRKITVDRLLNDPQFVRNWTTIWSNLLVGRKPAPSVDREALEKFLRSSFARNRPWKDIVVDLVSAEGDGHENGAANFLIAHMNNEAVPATAITARLFLGMQVQCTQCHNHPFNNWKQSQFWELNSFFQQTKIVSKKPSSKKQKRSFQLVNREIGGPIYYATRGELLMAAFPKFEGQQIDPDARVNRRAKLASLMFTSDRQLAARAMVNRMWAHFMGYGFTRRVDDMGPHNPPTHPVLLDRLTQEFVESGYDLKRLIRWICQSSAYQLSSRFNETNSEDDPSIGMLPIFSRVYVKSMTAEQLYDSLLVATGTDQARTGNGTAAQTRRKWLEQFILSFETEENDEVTTFDGTIPQALLLMNSELVQDAISGRSGTYFQRVLSEKSSDLAKIRKLSLAALSRVPRSKELTVFRQALSRPASRGVNRRQAKADALQDIFWALLNSNEFILVH